MLAKVCGLTHPADAAFAAAAGADLLGFVVHPPSPRHCAKLREASAGLEGRAILVTVSEDPEHMARIADGAGLRRIQPYIPREARERVVGFLKDRGFWVLLPWPDEEGLADPSPDLHLWESSPRNTGLEGGSGQTHGMLFPPRGPFLLAGGLGPDNLLARFQAIPASERAHLRGFDAASRLEREPGRKDPALVQRFIQCVKSLEPPYVPPIENRKSPIEN